MVHAHCPDRAGAMDPHDPVAVAFRNPLKNILIRQYDPGAPPAEHAEADPVISLLRPLPGSPSAFSL